MTKVEYGALPEFAVCTEELKLVSQKLQRSWLKLYPANEAMIREIQKAIAWYQADGERKKNLGMFLNNWLARSRELAAACEAHKEQLSKTQVTYHVEQSPEKTSYEYMLECLAARTETAE